MDASELMLEYLKEQYTQARQHETRQTATTTFLTAASAAILGIALKEGVLLKENWWVGGVVAVIGIANYMINKAHFIGNRFHTCLAGKVRRALEEMCVDWNGAATTSQLRREALIETGFTGPEVSIGGIVSKRLNAIPVLVGILGLVVALLARIVGT